MDVARALVPAGSGLISPLLPDAADPSGRVMMVQRSHARITAQQPPRLFGARPAGVLGMPAAGLRRVDSADEGEIIFFARFLI
jgi:hypothetical protein